jgi:hypothetical protein
MNTAYKIAAAALPLALMLTGCEGGADIARKPDVVSTLLDRADGCPTASQYPGGSAEHNARLQKVLEDSYTRDLDILASKGTTICLDRQLESGQVIKFSNSRLVGVYHQATNMARLWDNGTAYDSTFLTPDTISYGSKGIEKLVDYFQDGNVGTAYAGRVGCGKSCTTTKWGGADRFPDAVATNAGILAPMARLEAGSP